MIVGAGWAGAAPTLDPFGAVVVGVVVVVGADEAVVDDLVTICVVGPTAKGKVTVVTAVAGAGGLTEREVEVGSGTVVVVLPGACVVTGVVCPPLEAAAASLWGLGPVRPDVVAATRASRESDTASTAHQCGRIRSGRVPPGPPFERSPAIG